MKTIYLTIKSGVLTTAKFEKPKRFEKMKINKVVLTLNYKNITEKAHVKSTSSRVDFPPGFWSFKELQKSFDKLGATLSIEEFSQKAKIKARPASTISLSDNLRDLLGSDTKVFQAGSLTSLAYPCDILKGLKYFKTNCNEISRYENLKGEPNDYVVRTNTLGILNIKSFNFVGGTQYHDADKFCVKELIHTAFFNSLNFTLEGNNGQPIGEAFV